MIIHKTSHPQIFYAGGDLFGKQSLSQFDGFLAFAEGFTGFNCASWNAVNEGKIKCPYRIHGIEDPRVNTPMTRVGRIVRQDLDYLSSCGCRKIGIHTPNSLGKVKEALRAAVKWLDAHSANVDSLTFVDLQDDYFNCFGLESFREDNRGICNPTPTEFETYFEKFFWNDLVRAFGSVDKVEDWPACMVMEGNVPKIMGNIFIPIDFSVALFFANLIAQAIAKVTDKSMDMYAFAAVSGIPFFQRGMAGAASSYTLLADTGLLPAGNEAEEWMDLARKELPYFTRVMMHYVIGGIYESGNPYAIRLSRLGTNSINNVSREMKSYLDGFGACLQNDKPLDVYYIDEPEMQKD